MALKDWKKTKDGFKNESLRERITLEQGKDRTWLVQILDTSLNKINQWYSLQDKVFKSKSQAIAFARNYMQSH